jgi:hypothetical protein
VNFASLGVLSRKCNIKALDGNLHFHSKTPRGNATKRARNRDDFYNEPIIIGIEKTYII